MNATEKINYVLDLIQTARDIAPAGDAFPFDDSLADESKVSERELRSILTKLAHDHRVIEIVHDPCPDEDGLRMPGTVFMLRAHKDFDHFLEKQYSNATFGLDGLKGDAFFFVFDVLLDLEEQLSLTQANEAELPILNYLPRWRILLPADGAAMRDRYAEGRWKAAKFLKEIGLLTDAETDRDGWDSTLTLTVASRRKLADATDKMKALHSQQIPPKPTNIVDDSEQKLFLDLSKPMPALHYGASKRCDLDSKTLEFFMLQEVFTEHPHPADDEDIVTAWGRNASDQSLYDACARINKKLSELTGLSGKIVVHQNAKAWIDPVHQNLIANPPLTQTDSD